MKQPRLILVFAPFFLLGIVCISDAAQPLTKGYIQQLLSNPSPNQERLKGGTLHGCIHIPAKGFMQRLMVGFEVTGESCSVTVNQNNAVRVSFLGDTFIPVVSTSTDRSLTNILVGELENDQVLIVQHHLGEVASITQTVYDKNGDVVYGRSGDGDYIRECNFGMTTSDKLAGKKSCKK